MNLPLDATNRNNRNSGQQIDKDDHKSYLTTATDSKSIRKPTWRLRRDVFTSMYGQKPKHWVSVDRMYNMLVVLKFTGYAVIKLEP